MKHRTSLKDNAALAALMALLCAAIAGPVRAAEADKDTPGKTADPIRVGIITERSGPHLGIYFSSLAGCKGVSKVAFCDDSGRHFAGAQRSLGKAFGKVPTYRKPATMIAEFKPQLVIVAMPAHLSPAVIKVALEGGCNVLSEKPGCVRAEQFAGLVKLASAKKRLLMLSLPSRVSAQSLRAREIVQQGLLGKLYSVSVLQVKDQARLTRPSYQKSWYCNRDKSGGGHLIWLGIHNMDQVLFLTGDRVD